MNRNTFLNESSFLNHNKAHYKVTPRVEMHERFGISREISNMRAVTVVIFAFLLLCTTMLLLSKAYPSEPEIVDEVYTPVVEEAVTQDINSVIENNAAADNSSVVNNTSNVTNNINTSTKSDNCTSKSYYTKGLNKVDGINYYNGRKETYYSSRVLYHKDTKKWWVDCNGFYRDAGSFYVVASEDYPFGTVLKTSQGLAKVYDCGCPNGVVDFYVNW